jgi:hypothetical protein
MSVVSDPLGWTALGGKRKFVVGPAKVGFQSTSAIRT